MSNYEKGTVCTFAPKDFSDGKLFESMRQKIVEKLNAHLDDIDCASIVAMFEKEAKQPMYGKPYDVFPEENTFAVYDTERQPLLVIKPVEGEPWLLQLYAAPRFSDNSAYVDSLREACKDIIPDCNIVY